MITALRFDYMNHRNEGHTYKVIPLELGFERCKCFPGDPEKLAWIIRALVLTRSGVVRNVIRSFAVVKMINVEEVSIQEP